MGGRQIPYTMMKFACFERTVEAIYANVVPKPRDQCSKSEQLVVTFAAGYIAGVFCAVVSHPADTLVSYMNKVQGATLGSGVKDLGFAGLWGGLGPGIGILDLVSTPAQPKCHHSVDFKSAFSHAFKFRSGSIADILQTCVRFEI